MIYRYFPHLQCMPDPAASAILLIPGLEFHLICQFEAEETFTLILMPTMLVCAIMPVLSKCIATIAIFIRS